MTDIRLVVDSGSQLPAGLRERLQATVVPLTVVVDGVPLREGEQIDAAGITAALDRGARLSTSAPSPGTFLQAYEELAAAGATAVLSVHTGGATSVTAQSARVAARSALLPVEVVDTASASFPVTLAAWAAADALAAGADLATAAQAAATAAGRVGNVFVVGALGLARRGGRLADDVPGDGVPVLALADGAMRPVAQVAELSSAVEAMAGYVEEHSGGSPLRVGVGQLGAPELAAALEAALRDRLRVEELVRYVVGPSIVVHTGLGTVGAVFVPLD
jgi:DegV family protein with EDD domain